MKREKVVLSGIVEERFNNKELVKIEKTDGVIIAHKGDTVDIELDDESHDLIATILWERFGIILK